MPIIGSRFNHLWAIDIWTSFVRVQVCLCKTSNINLTEMFEHLLNNCMTHVHTHTHTPTHSDTDTKTCTHMGARTCTYTQTNKQTHTHARARTHTHTTLNHTWSHTPTKNCTQHTTNTTNIQTHTCMHTICMHTHAHDINMHGHDCRHSNTYKGKATISAINPLENQTRHTILTFYLIFFAQEVITNILNTITMQYYCQLCKTRHPLYRNPRSV